MNITLLFCLHPGFFSKVWTFYDFLFILYSYIIGLSQLYISKLKTNSKSNPIMKFHSLQANQIFDCIVHIYIMLTVLLYLKYYLPTSSENFALCLILKIIKISDYLNPQWNQNDVLLAI